MKMKPSFADAFEMWMADWQKQMDKPLRIVSDMVAQVSCGSETTAVGAELGHNPVVALAPSAGMYEPDPRDEEGSDVRPELEVYRGR